MNSKRASPMHEASLIDASLHSPALLELLNIKVSRPVIEYVVDNVVDAVDFAMGHPSTSGDTRGRSVARNPKHTKFTTFVSNVLTRAEVTMPVILAALVYVDRAKPHLHIALEEWACERVFLGAVILASKYLNDSTLKNVHWALCTGVFGKRDVGRVERELLDVLDFELGILEGDILSHHEGLSAVAPTTSSHRASTHAHRHHQRSHHTTHIVALPALGHSDESTSPSSSDSSSPYTPNAPEVVAPAPMDPKHRLQSPHAPPFEQSTLDLLRAFPIPYPTSMRHAASHFDPMIQQAIMA